MGALHQDSASLRREKLKLFLLFNFNGYTRKTSIKQLVAKYFVGKNSIVADLNTIKPQLMEYQLQLIRDKDGTQIKGRRKNIKTTILDSFHRFQKELLFDNLAEFQTDNPLDKIIFVNHLKEVVLTIKAADAFVLSSVHEGQPMVLLESLVLDTNILSTNIPGCYSILKDGYGLLVDNDTTGLVNGMEKMYTHEFKQKRFDYKKYNEEAIEMIENMLDDVSIAQISKIDVEI